MGNMKKYYALSGCTVAVALAVALFCFGNAANQEEKRTDQVTVATEFLETLYTADALRWQEYRAATGTENEWSDYHTAYATVATDACQSSMEHGLFTLVDAFAAETGAEPVIDDILLEPVESVDENLALYTYQVVFRLEGQGVESAETYRAEGTLRLLHYKNAAPRVHMIEVNDQNLFRYIQEHEGL